jgi:DNA-binding response OmpR family regulator
MKAKLPEKPVILVIDPDALTLTAIAASLHLSDYECICARDGEAALKAANSESLDLIICDVDVERGQGMELAKEIRQLPAQQDVPVMFISARQAPDIIRRSHEAGAAYYLRKPFDPEVMLELVDKALWMPHLVGNRLSRGRKATSQMI